VGRLSNGPCGPAYRRLDRGWPLATSTAVVALWGSVALADPQPQTISGVPQQIIPQAQEVGLPAFTIPTGTVSILGGAGGTGSTSTGGTGTSTDSSSLDTMLGTPWGASAQQSSEALGVNASALAATCVLESGCQNLGAPGSDGKITGAFQMSASTFQSSLNAALAQDPGLAANIVPGLAGQNDPATQAIAAAEYLKQGAQALEAANIPNPTVLDVRSYYNFGGTYGATVASAPDSQTMSSILPANFLSGNGITPGQTVGQWRAGVSAKIGNAAGQQVLT
jgi:hypothetical protein